MAEYKTRTGVIITSSVRYIPHARIPGIPNKNKWLLCLEVTAGPIKKQFHIFTNIVTIIKDYEKAIEALLPELFPDSVPLPSPEQISLLFKALKRTLEILRRKKVYMVEVNILLRPSIPGNDKSADA